MLAREFKVGDTFLNTNDNLCLVYSVRGGKNYVVNYRCNFYTMNRDGNFMYNGASLNHVTPQDFIKNFPKEDLGYHTNIKIWNKIVQMFQDFNMEQEILLLLL